MTINKAQSQTFTRVGIALPEPVFTHGQLYVALSRAGSAAATRVRQQPSSHIMLHCTYSIYVVCAAFSTPALYDPKCVRHSYTRHFCYRSTFKTALSLAALAPSQGTLSTKKCLLLQRKFDDQRTDVISSFDADFAVIRRSTSTVVYKIT